MIFANLLIKTRYFGENGLKCNNIERERPRT